MAIRMRVELVDVYCRDTEDLLVADIFYVMSAAMSCDADKTVLLTDPINIKTGETISFSGHDLAVFYADVAEDAFVLGGFKAFDEEQGKDWLKKSEWVKQIVEGLPAFGDLPSLPSEAAQVILTAAGNVLDEAAHSDRDDTLGEHLLAIPATGTSDEEMTWVFKQEGIGLSTWDYTVRYRIMRAEATHAL